MTKKLITRMAVVIVGSAMIITALGQGCSKWSLNEMSPASSDPGSVPLQSDDPSISANTQTIGLVYGKQILDNFTSCLGSGNPSERTLSVYDNKQGSISENGAVGTVTAPMLMATASIAGEVCMDLINAERRLSPAARRIFTNIDFTSNSLPSQGLMQDAVRRIARSCWNRDEQSLEADTIIQGVSAAFSAAPTAAVNTPVAQDAMLFICTSMMSSLDSIAL
jgi:hypothetical protein